MGRLTNAIREAANSQMEAAKKAPTPNWIPKLAVVTGTVLAIVLLGNLFFADNTPRDSQPLPPQQALPGEQPGPTSATVTTEPGVSSTTTGVEPGNTSPDGTALSEVSTLDGGKASVPTEALQVAQAAAMATITGDASGIDIIGDPPTLIGLPGVTDPKVTAVTLNVEPDRDPLVFTVALTPAPGAEVVSRTISVSSGPERWAWRTTG